MVKPNGARTPPSHRGYGGILPEDKAFIPAEIFRQAKVALQELTPSSWWSTAARKWRLRISNWPAQLIRSGKPLFLAVNKVDTEKQQSLTDEFHRLGIRKVFPISAENARGLDDLLDGILEILPAARHQLTRRTQRERRIPGSQPHETKVAIIGHPHVGNPRCWNRLTGGERSIVFFRSPALRVTQLTRSLSTTAGASLH